MAFLSLLLLPNSNLLLDNTFPLLANYGKSLATVVERMDQVIHKILIFGFCHYYIIILLMEYYAIATYKFNVKFKFIAKFGT